MPVNFNAIMEEERDLDMLFLDKAKSECYDVFNMKQEDFAQIVKDEKKPLLYFNPAKPLFRQSYLHHVACKPAHMPMLKVETFPSYIYSPLRVLNPYVHTEPDILLILDELDQIITKGDLTFTTDYPFGFSSWGNIPFSLSYLKSQTIIMLVDQHVIDECEGLQSVWQTY